MKVVRLSPIFTLCLWPTLVAFSALGQTEVATVSLNSNTVRNLSCFESNDTIFLSFRVPNRRTQDFEWRMLYIHPQGAITDIFAKKIPNIMPCGFELTSNETIHYFLEKSKGVTFKLNAHKINKHTLQQEYLEGVIVVEDPIIEVLNDMTLVTHNAKKNFIKLIKVKESKVIRTEKFDLSPELSNLKTTDFCAIQNGTAGWLYQAYQPVKIYVESENITVTNQSIYTRHSITTYNRITQSVKTFRFPETLKGKFSSSIIDSLLFTLHSESDHFTIGVYQRRDSGYSRLTSKRLFKDSIDKEMEMYFHSDKEEVKNRHEKTLRAMKLAGVTNPVIAVQKGSVGSYGITWGTFFNEKGQGIFMGADPLVALTGYLLATAVKQAGKAPNVSRYLFSTFENGKVEIDKDPGVVFKSIDDYEIATKSKGTTFHGYIIKNSREALSIVQRKNQLSVIKFKIE